MATEDTGRRDTGKPMTIDEWVETFGQLARLPFAMAAFGMDLFGQTARRFLDQTAPLNARVDQTTPTPLPPTSPAPAVTPPQPRPSATPARAAHEDEKSQTFGQEDPKTKSSGIPSGVAPNNPKEESMADKNLSDDMLKLVSYSIVCIERGNEKVLLCNACELFADNMTDCDFDSWVIASYCEKHRVRCDRKYLRVAYEVLGRWEKPDLQFEVKQLERLEDISDAIRDGNKKNKITKSGD